MQVTKYSDGSRVVTLTHEEVEALANEETLVSEGITLQVEPTGEPAASEETDPVGGEG